MLMVALAVPRAAGALGLGEIRVESSLNEPLAADIDIVGAAAEDLAGVTATIANRDTFLRYGVERPSFLSTTTFKIVRDSRGRAVLAVRSTEPFTEPLVGVLVDLRWHGGEAIRQYTLLLDPPGLAPAAHAAEAHAAEALPAADSPVVHPRPIQALPDAPKTAGESVAPRTIKVAAGTTLRAVARRVGARGDSALERTMIALFRANPSAFEGNVNRLRRGAVLTVPSAAEVSAIPMSDARHEFRIQMDAWRATPRTATRTKAVVPAVVSASATRVPAAPATAPAAAEPAGDAEAALGRKVQTLEKGINELQDLLDRQRDQLVRVQATVLHDEKAVAAADVAPKSATWQELGWPVAAVLALLAAASGALRIWRRAPAPRPTIPRTGVPSQRPPGTSGISEAPSVAAQPVVREDVKPLPNTPAVYVAPAVAAVSREARHDLPIAAGPIAARPAAPAGHALENIDVASLEASYLLESSGGAVEDSYPGGDAAETATLASPASIAEDASSETMPFETARLEAGSESVTVNTMKLDYNLLDLDETAHHVQMPSQLRENVGFKERRTSLVDALKLALEREPNRRDLRMKLLETYYAAAATNRQGFLDLVDKLAGEREKSPREEWDKIAWMGRQIASDSDLFASEAPDEDDDDLANCA
jgi:pilus assembly protein FimV